MNGVHFLLFDFLKHEVVISNYRATIQVVHSALCRGSLAKLLNDSNDLCRGNWQVRFMYVF